MEGVDHVHVIQVGGGSLVGQVDRVLQGNVCLLYTSDRASCLVKADFASLSEREGITLEEENGAVRIRGWGKGGHAAMPQNTVNSIGLIVNYLLDNHLVTADEEEFLTYLRKLRCV